MNLPTKTPSILPSPSVLWRRSISMAALDRLLSPDWEGRYYSFDPEWAPGEHMASMRNGSGDEVFIGFSKAGVLINGFAHESAMSPAGSGTGKLWPGLFSACPEALASFRDEPAFSPDHTTFCLTWDAASPGWSVGVTEFSEDELGDGSHELLAVWLGGAEAYADWAFEYFELDAPVADLAERVFAHDQLDAAELEGVLGEEDGSPDDALAEIVSFGYGTSYPFDG